VPQSKIKLNKIFQQKYLIIKDALLQIVSPVSYQVIKTTIKIHTRSICPIMLKIIKREITRIDHKHRS